MNQRLVARINCHGCFDEHLIPVRDVKVERRALYWFCPDCGWMARAVNAAEEKAFFALLGVPGGMAISELEVDRFARQLRRLDKHLVEEGLAVEA